MKKIFVFLVVILNFVLPLNVFAESSKEDLEQGQGTVREAVKSGDKEFYTITTPAEKTYYLVIDFEDKERNVYFLKAVDEVDLIDLAGVNEIIYTSEETTIETTEITTEATTENIEVEEELEEEKPKVDIVLIVGIGVLVASVVMFVLNKRKSKEQPLLYDDEEIENDEVVFKEEEDNSKDEILEQNNSEEDIFSQMKNREDRE